MPFLSKIQQTGLFKEIEDNKGFQHIIDSGLILSYQESALFYLQPLLSRVSSIFVIAILVLISVQRYKLILYEYS